MKQLAAFFGVVVASLIVVPFSRADDARGGTDAKFIREAASGGMMEVMLGQLATTNSQNPDVRKFGEQMVADHTKANKELMAVAQSKGIKVPTTMDEKCQAMCEKLKALKGAEFDKAYMAHMVKDHENDVSEFTKYSKDATDEQVKAFATKTLPTLKEHLQMSREVAAKVGAIEK